MNPKSGRLPDRLFLKGWKNEVRHSWNTFVNPLVFLFLLDSQDFPGSPSCLFLQIWSKRELEEKGKCLIFFGCQISYGRSHFLIV